MKRITALLLVVLIALSACIFSGCGASGEIVHAYLKDKMIYVDYTFSGSREDAKMVLEFKVDNEEFDGTVYTEEELSDEAKPDSEGHYSKGINLANPHQYTYAPGAGDKLDPEGMPDNIADVVLDDSMIWVSLEAKGETLSREMVINSEY